MGEEQKPKDENAINLTLNRGQFDSLLIGLGMVTGLAIHQDNKTMANSLLRLVNHINKDNPNWRPYDVPEDETSGR